MREIHDVAYAPAYGIRGLGDLYLPRQPDGAPTALCVHGGGWNAMDKYSWSGVAQMMCRLGYGALNINYRLLDDAPWPACGDDCIAAAEYLLTVNHSAMVPLDRSAGAVVIGGSAGAHLAMMTGLRMPREKIRAVVSIAGPSDMLLRARKNGRESYRAFFGTDTEITDQMLLEASPIGYVRPDSPPLLCVHSTNDKLVPIEHSHRIIKLYREAGARAELFAYPGPGEQHGIWVEGSDPHRLLPEVENAIANFLRSV